ncbi:MAG: hypothetical protein IT449_14460 [Phycisphaerales bacterium]|nr:hypothetical protein [Phycisphaerales bacterium]
MNALLFESPIAWIVVCLLGVLALLAYARIRGSNGARRAMWGVVPLLAAGLIVQNVVVTSREQLVADCRDMARKVEAGDIRGLGAMLSPRLEAARLDRKAFIEAVERTLARYHPEESRLAHFDVKFPDPQGAVVEFEASCRVVSQREVLQRLHTKWRLRFEMEGDAWKVTRIELVPMPTSPLSSLNDVLQ